MTEQRQLTLAQMEAGQSGIVAQIIGGHILAQRLEALGIRPGKKVTKQNTMLFHGPVTVLVDRSQVALGYGMASNVVLDVDTPSFKPVKTR
jgi:ferrous iron transport protein A